MLVTIMQWWNVRIGHCWIAEQWGIQLPLLELMLMEKDRLKVWKRGNYSYECLIKIWDKNRQRLAPHPSLLMSFIYHPTFGQLNDVRSSHSGNNII